MRSVEGSGSRELSQVFTGVGCSILGRLPKARFELHCWFLRFTLQLDHNRAYCDTTFSEWRVRFYFTVRLLNIFLKPAAFFSMLPEGP